MTYSFPTSVIPNWKISLPLTCENRTIFINLKPEKGTPFRRSFSLQDIIGSTPYGLTTLKNMIPEEWGLTYLYGYVVYQSNIHPKKNFMLLER